MASFSNNDETKPTIKCTECLVGDLKYVVTQYSPHMQTSDSYGFECQQCGKEFTKYSDPENLKSSKKSSTKMLKLNE